MRKLITICAALLTFSALSFTVSSDDAALLARAERLHDQIISIDTHTDSALHLPKQNVNPDKRQVTFAKLREGRVDCCFFPIYIGQGPRDDASLRKALDYTVEKMDIIEKYICDHSNEARIAYSPDDLENNKKQGKLSLVMGIENGYPIGRDLSNLEMFYNKGVRIITLSHNENNDICDSSRDSVAEWHGLSPFGRDVVAEMNRLGIIVDVSHTSTETLYDCLVLSKAPIMASHSCVYAIKDHPRNLTDDEIRAIAAHNGVIQVTTGRWALSWKPHAEVNIGTFCDHVDYIKNLVGPEYVGIGTDFDGGGGMMELNDASDMKYITVELMRRGWTDEELRLFWGGNAMRVWREVERVAAELQK